MAPGATPGSFPQVAGLAFSFDPDLPAGKRVKSLVIKDRKGKIIDVVVKNAELVGDSNRIFRAVTLNFLANGGDGYPFPKTERVDLISKDAKRTGLATFAADGSEQDALAEYLAANFKQIPFAQEDVPPTEDTRIQNLKLRKEEGKGEGGRGKGEGVKGKG
ncbi:5'-nucleotidase C-terminal domain-containing protein [Nostoc sp. DSM 114167]|uniref:5'-nucleotidase C-terminal domain-containing protein n=1 Tax=Nostoc sp. DSM 114167 TaxID=3439050 RepID=UPI0040456A0E